MNKKNLKHLVGLTLLGAFALTLFWALVEAAFALFGFPFSLSTGKIGFDLQAISFYINLNVGTFIGLVVGFIIFLKA